MSSSSIDYDVYLHWSLLPQCNFSCDYCSVALAPERVAAVDIPRVMRRLDELGETLLITFTGGEPLLVPNFIDLVREVTRKHHVIVETNLSRPRFCDELIDGVDPARIMELVFSTHVAERERRGLPLERLIATARRLQDSGFRITGNYVAHPSLLGRMRDDIRSFADQGVAVIPSYFVGRHDGRDYPVQRGQLSYAEEERGLIAGLNPRAGEMAEPSKGQPCPAGCRAFYINQDQVFVCAMINKRIGSLHGEWQRFSKAIHCPLEQCYCPFNRSFTSARFDDQKGRLLQRTLASEGLHSPAESQRLTGGLGRLLAEATRPARNRLGLRIDQPVGLGRAARLLGERLRRGDRRK